jgi:hypothetical protein
MKDVIFLVFHLLTLLAKLLRPGGSRTLIADKTISKPQPNSGYCMRQFNQSDEDYQRERE